jgi:hypothetical protein
MNLLDALRAHLNAWIIGRNAILCKQLDNIDDYPVLKLRVALSVIDQELAIRKLVEKGENVHKT